ncbi:MAG: hypothetical protein IPG47_14705 [Thermoflexaceae bacterium]|nr:hypothetical protein [Thermoflexaceae bacterium]
MDRSPLCGAPTSPAALPLAPGPLHLPRRAAAPFAPAIAAAATGGRDGRYPRRHRTP